MTVRDDILAEEGTRLKVYDDATGTPIGPGSTLKGHPTIGTGRALDTNGISQAEAGALLDADLARVAAGLDSHIPWWRGRSQSVQDALLDAAFQMGVMGLLSFQRMLSCLHAGDYEGAKAAGLDSDWARQTPARAARVVARFVG